MNLSLTAGPIGYRQVPTVRGRANPFHERLGVERNLVLVRFAGWQSTEDWNTVARHVRDIDPRIETFVVRGDMRNSYSRRKAARRPSLVFSPGLLTAFRPSRGKVYQGGPVPKLEQLDLLEAAGVNVPRTRVLTPDLRLDPTEWGDFIIVKPTDLATSSHGRGIQLMRTSRVRFIAPEDYPADHPGRLGPMIVQQFVNTGDRIALYRVLTLFGEPLYCQLMLGRDKRIDLSAPDEIIERAVVATQAINDEQTFVNDADVIAVARTAHAAIPEVPLKGCDIIRDAGTGTLYVLELNPGGNTWHFSSDYLAKIRAASGPEFEKQRRDQFDAMRTAARVLVERTNAEAK
jgi:hypothetical protein